MFKYKTLSLTVVCILLGVIMSLQYRSIYNNSNIEKSQYSRVETIKDDLLIEKKNNEALRKRNDDLEKQKKEIEDAHGNSSIMEANLKKELELSRTLAGLTDVKGRGIEVVLDNNDLGGSVEEGDILNLINELRASEAQAISVNNERVIATTEVREAGRYVVINGKQMMAPFIVKAIADPSKLENALKVAGGVAERLQELYKIKFTIEKKDEIIIPKIDESILKTNLLTPVRK